MQHAERSERGCEESVKHIDIHTGSGEARIQNLLALLDVSETTAGGFSGVRKHGGVGRIFGGEVVAQALVAACKTVVSDREIHSLHAYFLRGGDEMLPSHYQVEADFDGRSFSNRRVIASQNGAVILNLAASFHVAEPGHRHSVTMPDVPDPESLPDHQNTMGRFRRKGRSGTAVGSFLNRLWPIDIRPLDTERPMGEQIPEPEMAYWFRASGPVDAPQHMHRAILAFVSDLGALWAATLPYGISQMLGASIDHSIWFHADVQADQWMLYRIKSPWAGGARGLGLGEIFSRDGRLLATVAQEGLMRDLALSRG